jgi:hypothetical protein
VTTVLGTPDQLRAWREQIAEERTRRAEERRAQLEARCRDNFAAFFREGWHVIEGRPLLWNWHLEAQCDTAQAFAEGWLVAHGHATPAMIERQREHWARHGREMPDGELLVDHLVANGGPGTVKSRIWMVYLQAWVWLHAPSSAWLCSSGSGQNVTRDSGYAKDLVCSRWYRATFRIAWRVGATASGQMIDSVGKWVNSAGGERISLPILSKSWTGQRGDFLFIDDPDDALEVWGDAARMEVRDKFDRAIGNRLRLQALTLVLQQHVHAEDLTSVLKQRGAGDTKEERERAKRCGSWSITDRMAWAAFVLPVEFNPGKPSSTPWGFVDPRTEPAEVLFPVQWTPAVIASEKRRLGAAGWSAQGNQDPEHAEGGDVQRRWLGWCAIANADGSLPAAYKARPRGCWQRGEDGAPEAVVIKRKPDGRLDLDWLELHIDPKNGSLAKGSSNLGLVVVGGKGGERFTLDDRSRKLQFLDSLDAIRDIIRDWGPQGLTAVVVELKAQGEGIIGTLRREIAQAKLVDARGKPIVVPIQDAEGGSTAFEIRWRSALPAYRSGLVHILDGASWADEHVDEVCSVPNGVRDDRADCMAQAINRHAAPSPARGHLAFSGPVVDRNPGSTAPDR